MSKYVEILDNTRVPSMGTEVDVKHVGGGSAPIRRVVRPGIRTFELLREWGLNDDFQLSKGTADTIFAPQEVVSENVFNGDLLFVSSKVDAGEGLV